MPPSAPRQRRRSRATPRARLRRLLFALSASVWICAAAPAEAFELWVSESPDRSAPVALEGTVLVDEVHIFIRPEQDARRVRFFLDDTSSSAAPVQVENFAPFDFAGTARDDSAWPFDTQSLSNGLHTIRAEIERAGALTETALATFQVANSQGSFAIRYSQSASRAPSAALAGALVQGDLHAFVEPEQGVGRVRFLLDGALVQVENFAPYDLGGTAANGDALPLDAASLAQGAHEVVAEIELEPVGTAVVRADFDVVHPSILTASSGGLHFAVSLGGSGSVSLSVDSADGSAASIQVLADVPWLSVPTTATTPVALSVEANTSGLVPGNHSGSLILSSPSHGSLVIPVELEVMGPPPSGAPPIRVELPYILDFESDHGATPDGAGAGTGFTYLDPSTFGGYLPANLRVNHGAGVLEITTTSGLQYVNVNSLHNALGVGFDAPSQVTRIATRLLDPPPGTGKFEQAGL